MQLRTTDFKKILYIYAEDSNHSVFDQYYNIPVPYGIAFLLAQDADVREARFSANLLFKAEQSRKTVETEALQFLKNVIIEK